LIGSLDHIGIAVPSLDEALKTYVGGLGTEPVQRPSKILWALSFALFLSACSSLAPGDKVSINGAIDTVSASDLQSFSGGKLPSSVSISVRGRNESEFSVAFSSDVAGAFSMSGLPYRESLIFEIQTGQGGTPVDNLITFPVVIDPNIPVIFPVLSSGLIQSLISAVTAAGGVMATLNVDLSRGIILGALSPKGGFSASITGVDLVSKIDGNTVLSNNGPFYFAVDAQGQSQIVKLPPRFQDAESSYVIFNVQPGTYKLKLIGAPSSQWPEVTALAGKTTVGYGISGTR
jgi:catechol 2,3-dioxygenase-like lactoylglutathione lyase family enzyme